MSISYIVGHPDADVMKRLIILKSRFTTGKHKKTLTKEEAIWEVKKECRDTTLVAATLHELVTVPDQDAALLMALRHMGQEEG